MSLTEPHLAVFCFAAICWETKEDTALRLSLQAVVAATDQADAGRMVRERLQNAASISPGDWFEYTIGSPVMDLEAAPYGGARYPVEARMDARGFSRFHLDAGIGDAVMEPLETVQCRDGLGFAGIKTRRSA